MEYVSLSDSGRFGPVNASVKISRSPEYPNESRGFGEYTAQIHVGYSAPASAGYMPLAVSANFIIPEGPRPVKETELAHSVLLKFSMCPEDHLEDVARALSWAAKTIRELTAKAREFDR